MCQESSKQWCFCERWKLAYKKNIKHHILIRGRFYRVLKPLHMMFYRPFDRSMGLWIINEFLNGKFTTCEIHLIQTLSSVCSTSLLVRILMTSFTTFSWLFVQINQKIIQSTVVLRTPRYYLHDLYTLIIWMAAKFVAKINYRRLTEINSHCYGLSLLRTLTHGPEGVCRELTLHVRELAKRNLFKEDLRCLG